MANQPDIIPSAWAANNSTTESIPATTTESGKASWDQGFPVETSLPLSEGGIPPKYGDFNGILNVLSQFCLFAQSGGQYAWSATLDYSVGSIVLGTDGSIYRAVQVSGPSTAAVNPVGDTSGKWERIVSQSDIDALETDIQTAMTNASDAVSNASAAQSAVSTLDANVVKLSGNQTIAGTKTFSADTVKFSANTASLQKELTQPSSERRITLGLFNTTISEYMCSVGIWWTPDNAGVTIAARAMSDSNSYFAVALRTHSSATEYFEPTSAGIYLGRNATGYKWKQVIAETATISTSDERLKSSIDAIPDAVLDAWDDVDWRQFQFKDAIAEKGADKARLHTGLVAQRIASVFDSHGLDASRYGLWCLDHWDATPEERDEKGDIVTPAREAEDAYAIRYEEALCMEAAYQRRRADRAEARISALERRLNEMEAAIASLISPIGDETYEQDEVTE